MTIVKPPLHKWMAEHRQFEIVSYIIIVDIVKGQHFFLLHIYRLINLIHKSFHKYSVLNSFDLP